MLVIRKIEEIEGRLKNIDSALRHLIGRKGSPKDFLHSLIPFVESQLVLLKSARYLLETGFPGFSEGGHIERGRDLSSILEIISNVERTVVIELENILPYVESWISQKQDNFVSVYQSRLDDLLAAVKKTAFRHHNIPILSKFGHRFLSVSPAKAAAAVITVPYTEIKHPACWSLAVHEVGHVYYKLYEKKFLDNLMPIIEKQYTSSYGEVRGSDITQRERASRWIPEFAADIFALHAIGPAYYETASTYFFSYDCMKAYNHYPPAYSRLLEMHRLLKRSLNFPGYDPSPVANAMKFYADNGIFQREFGQPFDPVECCKKIDRLMQVDMAIKNWDKIRELSGAPQKIRKCKSIYLLAAALPLADASLRAGIERNIVDGW